MRPAALQLPTQIQTCRLHLLHALLCLKGPDLQGHPSLHRATLQQMGIPQRSQGTAATEHQQAAVQQRDCVQCPRDWPLLGRAYFMAMEQPGRTP